MTRRPLAMTHLTLNVEYAELTARARDIEAQLAGVPLDNADAACTLQLVRTATEQLALSADNMRIYLAAGDRERGRLAQSLRDAADAYRETDERAADALDNETAIPATTPKSARYATEPEMLTETASTPRVPVPYSSAKEAVLKLMSGDQGASLLRFADAWTAYQRKLLEARYRFRPFTSWDSDARLVAEQNLDQQRSWLDHMATLCGQLATQARNVVAAHRWAVSEHPTLEQIRQLDERWIATQGLPEWERNPLGMAALLRLYSECQAKSEAVLAEYERRVALAPVSPPSPPNAYKCVPPPDTQPEPGPLPGPGLDPNPLPDTGLPFVPPALPSMPLGGMPSASSDPTLAATMSAADKSTGRPAGPALKPASFGGRGTGVPSMPLQPHAESGLAAAPGGAGAGRAIPIPAAYAALNGGGGAGMPMGAAHGQAAGKGKRAQQDESALYVEDRPWTEAVIGRRRVA
nr:secretion protein EspB [Mycobacterium shigaense]MEA1123907.1 secretion protein EspB [Mycobacterium shigaense]